MAPVSASDVYCQEMSRAAWKFSGRGKPAREPAEKPGIIQPERVDVGAPQELDTDEASRARGK